MSECKCDFRTRMVGDGCEACNPAKSLEYAKQTIADLEQEAEQLRAELAALRNDLSDALDCKNGAGPTALSRVIDERDSLRAELAAAKARADRLTLALDWISQKLFVKSWCGAIGAPSSWRIAGDYRHTQRRMKGATLLDAVEHAALAEGGEE